MSRESSGTTVTRRTSSRNSEQLNPSNGDCRDKHTTTLILQEHHNIDIDCGLLQTEGIISDNNDRGK